MKPLTKKILESGIVDRTTALMMERWKMLDDGAADMIGAATRETLKKFVDDIEELIEADHEIKETRLDVPVKTPPKSYWSPIAGHFAAVEDEMGRLITVPLLALNISDPIWEADVMSGIPPNMIILGIDKLYNGDKVFALQVTVRRQGE